MAPVSGEAKYPIAAVSKLTGVSCHTLRVWERRYGFPVPSRSRSGHRRYRHDQVMVLRRLSELSREGRPIGELIADLLAGGLATAAEADAAGAGPTGAAGTAPGASADLVEFLDRMTAGDVEGGRAVYERAEAALGVENLIERVVAPALTEVGDSWFRGRCSVYQEHCVSGFLRQKLAVMIDRARRANPRPDRTVLAGTVQGERHEGGVLTVNLLLERAGWRVVNLGADLPVSEYAKAVEHVRPDALALSFVLSRNINKRFQELSGLRGVPVFVGGRSILNYQKLARRHGLIPLTGPATSSVPQMLRDFEDWSQRPR